jgi:hypothetical protein
MLSKLEQATILNTQNNNDFFENILYAKYPFFNHKNNNKNNVNVFMPLEEDKNENLLESLSLSNDIDSSLFVKHYAPTKPYTILPLNFKTILNLPELSNLINDILHEEQYYYNISFEPNYINSSWNISYKQYNFNINVYDNKNDNTHIVEFHYKSNSDYYSMIRNLFEKMKKKNSEYENKITELSNFTAQQNGTPDYENIYKTIEENIIKSLEL